MIPRLKGQKVAAVRVNICHYLLEHISHIFTVGPTEALEERARALQSQSRGLKREKNVWGLAWKGLGILEYFSSSTFEKLCVRDRQSLPPERVCMLSSVKDGHLKVFEVLAQGQMTS